MGTMLQAKGLPVGATPELTALDHPEWLLDIHRAYVEAGAQILYANTFGANREKLSHCGRTVEEIVPAAVALAKEAAQGRALVALDIGPTGAFWTLRRRWTSLPRWCAPGPPPGPTSSSLRP